MIAAQEFPTLKPRLIIVFWFTPIILSTPRMLAHSANAPITATFFSIGRLFAISEDVGFRGVLVHLGTVVGLMKIHTDYKAFERQLDQIAPIYPETPGLFDNPKDWEEPQ